MFKERFERSKKFSDFVGFHVRALFCLTLMFVALFPSMDSFFLALAYQDPDRFQRSLPEILFQVGAVGLFCTLMLVLYGNIAITIYDYAKARWPSKLVRRAVFVSVALAMEVCGAAAIGYMVFLRSSAALALASGERTAINVRFCLIEELNAHNGLVAEVSADCVAQLAAFRADLPD